jgi:hypothetical protein
MDFVGEYNFIRQNGYYVYLLKLKTSRHDKHLTQGRLAVTAACYMYMYREKIAGPGGYPDYQPIGITGKPVAS